MKLNRNIIENIFDAGLKSCYLNLDPETGRVNNEAVELDLEDIIKRYEK